MAKLGDLVVHIGANTKKLNSKLGLVQRNMRSMTSNFTRLGMQMTKAITLPILGIGAMAVKSAADLERMEVGFISLTGGAKQAADMMKQLNEFTAKTPFQIDAIATSARQLIASGTKISEVNEQLQFLGDIAATTGQPINEIAAIFAKVNAKGKVELENLNQLAERGIPVFKGLADATGLLPSELGAGAVTVKQFNDYLKSLSEEGGIAEGAMERLSETASGKFSTALDNLKLAGAALAEDLLPAVNRVLDSIIELAQGFTALSDKTKKNIIVVAGLVATIGPLLLAIPRIITGIKLIGLAFATSMPQILAATVAIAAISLLFLDTSREASKATVEIKKVETALKDLNKAQLEIEAQVSPGAGAEQIAESMEFAALRVQEADEEIKRIQQAIADRGGFVGVGARKQLNEMEAYRNEFLRVINAGELLIEVNKDLANTPPIDKGAVAAISSTISNVQLKLQELAGMGTTAFLTLSNGVQDFAVNSSTSLLAFLDDFKVVGEEINEIANTTSQAFTNLGDQISGALVDAIFDAENFGEAMLAIGKQILKTLLSEAIANAIANASSAMNVANQASGGLTIPGFIAAAVGTVTAAFSNVPKLFEGGLAYGPTLAMVGDNRGANIDPEVVAPLSKLKDILGKGGSSNLYGRISGDDIVISNSRAARDRNRYV